MKHNGTIYLCGQVCADATLGITEQTQTMLDKVEQLLHEALVVEISVIAAEK
nr:hypothetical protein [Vibrio galatheae]